MVLWPRRPTSTSSPLVRTSYLIWSSSLHIFLVCCYFSYVQIFSFAPYSHTSSRLNNNNSWTKIKFRYSQLFLYLLMIGAIFGGTDMISTRSITKEAYLKHNNVPDWADLSYNCREEDKISLWRVITLFFVYWFCYYCSIFQLFTVYTHAVDSHYYICECITLIWMY
jgi:hypothetical protein